jgi:hypothetical protein
MGWSSDQKKTRKGNTQVGQRNQFRAFFANKIYTSHVRAIPP